MAMSFFLARGGGACARRVSVYRISRLPDAPLARIVPDTTGPSPRRGSAPLTVPGVLAALDLDMPKKKSAGLAAGRGRLAGDEGCTCHVGFGLGPPGANTGKFTVSS